MKQELVGLPCALNGFLYSGIARGPCSISPSPSLPLFYVLILLKINVKFQYFYVLVALPLINKETFWPSHYLCIKPGKFTVKCEHYMWCNFLLCTYWKMCVFICNTWQVLETVCSRMKTGLWVSCAYGQLKRSKILAGRMALWLQRPRALWWGCERDCHAKVTPCYFLPK